MTDNILESISDGVFTVDSQWHITSFNRAAENITGISRLEAIGALCCEVFKSNMCESECPLRKTLKTGKPVINKSGYIITVKGERIPVSVSTALLLDSKGTVIGGAETFRDLREIEMLKSELKSRAVIGPIASNSASMEKLIEVVNAAAPSESTILIQGETGTGKELLARSIHELSGRKKGPFVAVNCGALPDTLLESELFGYKKGAFTGADKDKPGRFALAKNGTVFLDEIGEMPLPLQVKLLRVLQEREYEPLGAVKAEHCDFRVICATNNNLRQMVAEGAFREDLYYRINVIELRLPPLRERKEDIPLLAETFMRKFSRIMNKQISSIHPEVFLLFYSYNWPGNIRELENVIERAVVLCEKKEIRKEYIQTEQFLPVNVNNEQTQFTIRQSRDEAEKISIQQALDLFSNDVAKSARHLGVDRATLYRKIKRYKISL